MRLIDADAFKEYLKNAFEEVKHVYADGGVFAWRITEDFCRDIDEQPTINAEPRWIPCSERLPDVGAILISDGNQVFIGAYYGNNTWSADGCDYDPILENIAWMPLPEPYKER